MGVYSKALLCMTGVALCNSVSMADMPVEFLTVDKVGGAVEYGSAYNMRSKQFVGKCVEFSSPETYDGGSPEHESTIELAQSTSDIVKKSNLSASASLSALAGGAKISANNKTSVVANSEASMFNLTLFASWKQYDQPKFRYFEHAQLTQQAQALLADPKKKGEFKQRCGDGFVIGVQEGRDFLGTATVKKQSLKQSTEFTSKTGIGVKSGVYDAEANMDIEKALTSSFNATNFKIHTYSTGSDDPDPSSVEELISYYKHFGGNSKDYKRRVNFIVAPYTALEGYPYKDVLQGDTKEDYIGYMADALWDLKAAMKDADFVINRDTRAFFALGNNANKKRERVSAIKKYKKAWNKEFSDLLKAAQKCDKNFTQQCKQLGSYYKNDRLLNNDTSAIMPERYVDDCYTPITIKPGDSQKLTANLVGGFDTVAGDNETGGNHVRVVAALKYFTDKRVMKAELDIAKIEWKRKSWRGLPLKVRTKKGESGFGKKITYVAFDLDNPSRYGLPYERKLTTCRWRNPGNPVTLPKRYIEPKGESGFQRYGFNGGSVHGVIDSISKRNSRGQAEYGPGKGGLNGIRCAVDAKGRHDNRLTCKSVDMRSITLNLVSSQDQTADGWKDPNKYREPTLLVNFLRGRRLNYKMKRRSIKQRYTIPASQLKKLNSVKKMSAMKIHVPMR